MGFDAKSNQISIEHLGSESDQSKKPRKRDEYWGHVTLNATHLINFIDLCGHKEYLKTTLAGLTGLLPDYGMIVISAETGIEEMTKNHIKLCLFLQIRFFIVITKIDKENS